MAGDQLVACPVEEWSLWDRLQARHEFPLEVMLCLTERCPLACEHCYIPPAAKRARDELTRAEIEPLLDELAELGTLKLTLTGGEPALRPDLVEIVAAAHARRFALALKSSCYPLDGAKIEALWDAGLTELNASLYHADPAAHDRFTGQAGSHERVLAALSRFQELGGVSRVSVVAMEWNAEAIAELITLSEERGWPYAVDPRIIHREDGADDPTALRASEETLVRVLDDMGLSGAPIPPRDADSAVCLAGRNSAYVTPRGEVWACPNLPMSFGNVRELSFAAIWRGSKERARITSLTWGESSKCMGCELMSHCERCPGEAFLEHGDLTQPAEVDCLMAKVRAGRAKQSTSDR